MRIVCPHCQAAYRVDAVPPGAVLICHRCKGRFTPGDAGDSTPPATPEEQLPLFEPHPRREEAKTAAPSAARRNRPAASASRAHAIESVRPDAAAPPPFLARPAQARIEPTIPPATEAAKPKPAEPTIAADPAAPSAPAENFPLPPPMRKGPRIWPWLAAILMVIAGAGFYLNKDAWLAQPALRGWLAALHLPLPPSDADWKIVPESVRAQWITRNDGSRALVIEGKLINRLTAPLPPPAIEIAFFDPDAPSRIVLRRVLPFTRPPSLDRIRHAPWSPPPEDRIPVPGRGSRAFVLVLDTLPDTIGDFTLSPRAGAQ